MEHCDVFVICQESHSVGLLDNLLVIVTRKVQIQMCCFLFVVLFTVASAPSRFLLWFSQDIFWSWPTLESCCPVLSSSQAGISSGFSARLCQGWQMASFCLSCADLSIPKGTGEEDLKLAATEMSISLHFNLSLINELWNWYLKRCWGPWKIPGRAVSRHSKPVSTVWSWVLVQKKNSLKEIIVWMQLNL